MTIAETIKALRRDTALTQQRFSYDLGIAISALQNYEAGSRPDMRALYIFYRVSAARGRHDLAEAFREHIHSMPGMKGISLGEERLRPLTRLEESAATIFLDLLRRAMAGGPPELKQLVAGMLDALGMPRADIPAELLL